MFPFIEIERRLRLPFGYHLSTTINGELSILQNAYQSVTFSKFALF
jgi:hypothetical protein